MTRMSITLLGPGQRLPVPRLDKDGALSASALCTWLRELADQSARTVASALKHPEASRTRRLMHCCVLRNEVDIPIATMH